MFYVLSKFFQNCIDRVIFKYILTRRFAILSLIGIAVVASFSNGGRKNHSLLRSEYKLMVDAIQLGSDVSEFRLQILESIPNVNTEGSIGVTALMEAARVGNLDFVDVLICHCAEVNNSDSEGSTALIVAATKGIKQSLIC